MPFDGLHLGFGKKLPIILQTEAAECGLAALAMVACYHGHVTDLGTLRSRYSISLKGTTLAELIKIATALKFQVRPLRLELDEMRELKTPCVLHWDLSHFVVLKAATRDGIAIHDPAHGRRKFKYEEVSKHFTGVGLELTPDIQFEKKEEKQQLKLRTLFGKVTGLKQSLLQVFLLAGALEVFGIVAPFFSQWIIDDALVSGDQDLLTILAIGALLVALIQLVIGVVRSWVMMHLSTTLSLEWLASIFSHLLKLPGTWFEKRHLGDVVSRFGSIGSIQGTLTGGVIGVMLDGLMAIITLALMFVYGASLSAIAFAAVILYAAIRIARYDALRDASAESLVLQAKQQSHFMESIRGIQTLKLSNSEGDRLRRYLKLAVDSTNSGLSIQKQNMVFSTANGLLVAAENAAILYLGAKLVLANQLSIGMLMAFISYKTQFISRISALIDTAISFRMLSIQTERLADIVLTAPEDAGSDYQSNQVPKAEIEVKNVSFRYAPGEPWVLRRVNLKIECGEAVAIAGPSGCGKTTLLKIMLGQLKPDEGEVLVGAVSLKQLGLKRHREQIGVVLQDDQMFAGSLAENIALFDPQAEQSRIEAAAKLASIDVEIAKMPMGFNTLAGDMGTGLSGGQKQRVLLARALYRRPRFLFLDEATSHLDIGTEAVVNQALRRMRMTRIVIAHRPQTLAMADRVIILPVVNERASLDVGSVSSIVRQQR